MKNIITAVATAIIFVLLVNTFDANTAASLRVAAAISAVVSLANFTAAFLRRA